MNAISFDEINTAPVEDPETSAKSHLRKECENATLRVKGGKFVYGNSRGHSLLEGLDAMKRQIDILFSKEGIITGQMQNNKRKIEEHQRDIIALKGQVGRLIQTSEGYLCTGRRFLDIYQKDIKDNEALKGSTAMKEGKLRAQEGDALADALLSNQDHRSDTRLYRDLSGLDYRQVLELHSMYNLKYWFKS